jgi:hypothetical protein
MIFRVKTTRAWAPLACHTIMSVKAGRNLQRKLIIIDLLREESLIKKKR